MTTLHDEPTQQAAGGGALGRYVDGVRAVIGMELRQRLRSRGWYILLVIWFGLIWLVTALTWISWRAQEESRLQWDPGFVNTGPGALIFEVVMAFVLLFGLLVAPAFSANAISGDRAGGTLAIMQVTLLRSGQLLWGKFLASWIVALAFLVVSTPFLIFGIVQGGLGFGYILVALLMLGIELGIACALGVGLSAVVNRPLFSIVVTYLVVAVLAFGTLIAFGLGSMVSNGTVQVNSMFYKNMEMGGDPGDYPTPPTKDVTDQNDEYVCFGPIESQQVTRTDRVAWMLAMNPFVVIADALPSPNMNDVEGSDSPNGIFGVISQGARYAQAGPVATTPCVDGKVAPRQLDQQSPLWPLGLGLQLVVVAGILALGWRALRTPARKLPRGTRVA